MSKFLFLIFLFIPLVLSAQRGKQNFVYINQATRDDLKGKKIVEFIKADIATLVLTEEGLEVSREESEGFLVTYKTVKGKSLGIRGINIENKKTGELTYYDIGTKDGLQLEKITDSQMFLKGKSFKGGDKEYTVMIICSFLEK